MSVYSKVNYNLYFDSPIFETTKVELLKLGDLYLSTGQVVACDPLVGLGNTDPFSRIVPPGRYPVIACIAKTGESGDRYAAVKLEFTKRKAVKWEMAISIGDDVKKLKDGEYLGFLVDAGLGCFCDVETQEWYNKWFIERKEKRPDDNIYTDFLAAEFKKNAVDSANPNDIGDWVNFYLPNRTNLNVIMFHSGYGDGVYACYWGLTDNEEICSLVVDFQVI